MLMYQSTYRIYLHSSKCQVMLPTIILLANWNTLWYLETLGKKNYKKFYILSPAFIESPCLYITMVCVLLFTVIADWYSADGPRGTVGLQMMDSWEFFIS